MRGRPHKVQSFATTVVVAFFFVACGGHVPEVMETSGDLPALLPQGIADSFSLNYYELPSIASKRLRTPRMRSIWLPWKVHGLWTTII